MSTTMTRLIRGLSARLTESLDSRDAADLAGVVRGTGCCHVANAERGHRVTLVGRVRTVLSGGGEHCLGVTAEVYDGSGAVNVCWLGRTSIPGIDTGRFLKVTGRIGVRDGQKIMFNPRYELLSGQPVAGRRGEA
ncbi:OB-fold nucleic acid binding domain-containing protein [Dietzia sp. PP-33]|jgi:hypothetical protein|uniref:OB-fold nucleic acid binding domain-containing protein n=1 Tax=Dietzia sp. PP-33 TaxID=2957500 RepID=UPI0029B873C9|nr:OB-fold nucleic acid binding domain-containing protein [Dietzia sp. PP-33]MDX2355345.1 OB-fold nucleic acid binding domain-containing protein [Dietzia sp. PP-33]